MFEEIIHREYYEIAILKYKSVMNRLENAILQKTKIRLDIMIKMRNISRRCIRKWFRFLKYISRCVNLIDGKTAIN